MNQKDKINKQQKVQPQQKKQTSKNNQNLWIWVALSVVFLTTFVIYYKAIKFDFLFTWDDNLYLTKNAHISNLKWENVKLFFTNYYVGNYQPITILFYALEYKIGDTHVSIFHFNNIVIHILNTYLVFVLIRKISPKNIMVAFITAAFFAIHPMHIESVVWVSERKDVLYSFFFLLSLIMYTNYLISEKVKHIIYVGIFFVLSCMSKSAAVILPFIMLLFDYYSNRKYNLKMLIEKIPFFAISLMFGLVALQSQKEGILSMAPNMSIIEHISIVSYSFSNYIFKAFIPINLSAIYPYPTELGGTLPIIYYLSILCVGLILFFVGYSRRWGKDVVFSFLFFVITIILVLQFVPVGAASMADRYTYIPYIGIFFIIGKLYEYLSLQSNINYKRYLLIVLSFGFIAFSYIANERIKIWKNDDTLFSDVINKYPNSGIAYHNRGNYYLLYCADVVYANDTIKKKMYIKKTIIDFENAVKLKLDPKKKFDIYQNLGIAKSGLGDFDGAILDYNKSIEIDSLSSSSYLNRGNCYINYSSNKTTLNNIKREMYLKKAIIDFESTLKLSLISSEKLKAYYNLGTAKFDLGDFIGAKNDFDKAIKIDTNYAIAYYNRGNTKYQLKNYKGAIEDYNKAIELNPQDANAKKNRDIVNSILGSAKKIII